VRPALSMNRDGSKSRAKATDAARCVRRLPTNFFAEELAHVGKQVFSSACMSLKELAPRRGLEPLTFRLTAERSTIELPGNRGSINTLRLHHHSIEVQCSGYCSDSSTVLRHRAACRSASPTHELQNQPIPLRTTSPRLIQKRSPERPFSSC
jgi:hypothetical protein